MRKEIVIMIGIAGSGKSVYVNNNFINTHQIICADDIRKSLGHTFEPKIEPLVHSITQILCRAYMIRELPIVIDETNTRLGTILKWGRLADEYQYYKCGIFLSTPLEICIERRPSIPREVLERMSYNLTSLSTDILEMYFDEIKIINY